MDTSLLRARLNLNSQYRRENGEELLFFNRNSLQIFNNFYQRRNLIGTLIFE